MLKSSAGLQRYADESVLILEAAPHEWLFPRCACTMHHGGAGTTQAALRSGVPTIIAPISFDQFFFAQWVEGLGCGVRLSLTENAQKLIDPLWSKTFRKCTSDEAMRAKAKEVAEALRQENGAKECATRIQEIMAFRETKDALQ